MQILFNITKTISPRGTSIKRNVGKKEKLELLLSVTKEDEEPTTISIEAINEPSKYEPESPISNLEGLKLYGIKPIQQPDKTVAIKANSICPFEANRINKNTEEMETTPAAKPSKPSIQLIALVTPTSQITVNRKPRKLGSNKIGWSSWLEIKAKSIELISRPFEQAQKAKIIWNKSLTKGDNENTSSKSPIKKEEKLNIITVRKTGLKLIKLLLISKRKNKDESTKMKPVNIAKPPTLASGVWCIFLWSGLSTRPFDNAILIIKGDKIYTIKAEDPNAKRNNAFTLGINNSYLFILAKI